MSIPMVLSSVLAMAASRSSSGYSSTFMYTGIITAIASALIGAVWAVNNVRYAKGKAQREENHRFEAYGEYLIRQTEVIREKCLHRSC